MYVKGIEESAMEDLINILEKVNMLPTSSSFVMLRSRHLLRLTSFTTATPFIMSMFMFCKLLI